MYWDGKYWAMYCVTFENKLSGNPGFSLIFFSLLETEPADSSSSDSHSAAGISIPHDGLPKISSVHSYHSGKSVSYPLEKDEKVIYHPPHSHHHHHHHHPRFFHPPPHAMYHPGSPSTGAAHPSSFTHAHQVVPIHVPYEHVVEDSAHAPPLAYYPFLSGEGKQMQWMFYPMSIPVNAVRPMVSEKSSSGHQKENVTPGDKENEHTSPSPHTCPNKMKYVDGGSLGDRKIIKEHSPIIISDDYSSPPVVIPLEKKSFMQHIETSQSSTHNHRDGGSKTFSSSSSSDHHSSSASRFSVQSKEAALAKKRKQLLGIVDRVTEVAARKSSVENIVRIGSTCERPPPPPPAAETTVVNLPSVVPLVTSPPKKYGNELMDSYIDEIAMEAAKLRDKQKRERDKPYALELCAVTPPPAAAAAATAGIPLKTATFMSKIRNRLDDILKNSEEEKEEILKEYSSSDTVRNILSSPPEFISRQRSDDCKAEQHAASSTEIADQQENTCKNVHDNNNEHNNSNHSNNNNTTSSDDENDKYMNTDHVVIMEEINENTNEMEREQKQEKDKSEMDDRQLDQLLFDPADFEKLKKAHQTKANILSTDKSESVFRKHDDGEPNDIHMISTPSRRDFQSIEHLLMQEPSSMEENVLLDEQEEMACLNDEKHSEGERAELKQYFTRKKLKLKVEELRMKRNVAVTSTTSNNSADLAVVSKRMREEEALLF